MNNDLISRSALFKAWDALDKEEDPDLIIDEMIKVTQDTPAVDAEPVRHGRWILNKHYGDYECSECGAGDFTALDFKQHRMNYCPNCGCKMDIHK